MPMECSKARTECVQISILFWHIERIGRIGVCRMLRSGGVALVWRGI